MSAFSAAPRASEPRSQIVVGISDGKVSVDGTPLVTYALGSCVAVCAFNAASKVAGLLHIMLPDSSLDLRKAADNPCMFADTGVAYLLAELSRRGSPPKGLSIRLAGGAQVMNDAGLFSIGKRNYTAVRKSLWKAGLMVDGEAVGGEVSRTVRLDPSSGRVVVREGGGREFEIPLKRKL